MALLPFYAGPRVGEVVGLDLDDVALSARKGTLRIRGKGRDGGKLRELPLTRPELRVALTNWLDDRSTWPVADASPALLLNRRGGRLADRSTRTIITSLGEHIGLGHDDSDSFGPHVQRHTFATQLLRGGADPVLVADLLGHSDLTNLKIYTQPNDEDRERALALLNHRRLTGPRQRGPSRTLFFRWKPRGGLVSRRGVGSEDSKHEFA